MKRHWIAAAVSFCAVTAVANAAGALAAGGAAGPHLGRAVRLQLPLNALQGRTPIIESATCASAASCTLAGLYTDNASVDQAMVVTRSGGHWRRAIELAPPANADPGIGGLAESVGNYALKAGGLGALIMTRSGMRRTTVSQIRLPAGAATGASQNSQAKAIGWALTGFCAVGGTYRTTTAAVAAMAATGSP